MRCRICNRALFKDATNGLQIGPKCAKDRGLLARSDRPARVRLFSARRSKPAEDAQVDWINLRGLTSAEPAVQ